MIPEEAKLTDHDCNFEEAEILETDEDEVLKAGMKVMLPCSICGLTPLDQLDWLTNTLNEVTASLNMVLVLRDVPLFHWSPTPRRKQIIRHGLLPNRRPTTNSVESSAVWKAPYTCLSEDPAWAWAISGGQKHSPDGEWDLWQTWASFVEGLEVLPSDRDMGIHEVRTSSRIYKRHLHLLGTRVK